MAKTKKKIYVYVDESGQDTKGLIFIVSVLILGQERNHILADLEKIEMMSGKKNLKWNKSRHEFRKNYIESILRLKSLENKILFDCFSDSKKYIELTSYTVARAILKNRRGEYKATIFIDGFKKRELELFRKGLRELRIRMRKIRTVKKDENNAFIRLVDAICGLIRDVNDGNPWAISVFRKLNNKKVVVEL